MLHSPVLLEESIDFLITNPSGKYIDATFGRGGHSRKILDSITKDGALLALDKDIDAIRFAEENFKDKNFSINYFIKKLNLSLIHVHANNSSPVTSFGVPLVLELTFSRNCAGSPRETSLPHKLDAPNDPRKPEILLSFS